VTPILHVTTRAAWEAAQREGVYAAPSLKSEGFIHFSQAHQVVAVANAFFSGQQGLVVLEADVALLRVELRWEPPAGLPAPEAVPPTELFPHLYGPLNINAVIAVHNFPPGPDGLFALPASLTVEH
jgi:uncharacterized protein (DUF952 family)